MSDSVTVWSWVARDKIPAPFAGALWSYAAKPKRLEDGNYYPDKISDILAPLDHIQHLFPFLENLRPEDGPKRIRLTLEILDREEA